MRATLGEKAMHPYRLTGEVQIASLARADLPQVLNIVAADMRARHAQVLSQDSNGIAFRGYKHIVTPLMTFNTLGHGRLYVPAETPDVVCYDISHAPAIPWDVFVLLLLVAAELMFERSWSSVAIVGALWLLVGALSRALKHVDLRGYIKRVFEMSAALSPNQRIQQTRPGQE